MVNVKVLVRTTDRLFAGTDANVWIKLHGAKGEESGDLKLNNIFRNDFKQGTEDTFHFKDVDFSADIDYIEVWRDDFGFGPAWMADHIVVTNADKGTSYTFPLLKWVKPHRHYFIKHLDTSLPQHEPFPDMRALELDEKRKIYQLKVDDVDLPAQVNDF